MGKESKGAAEQLIPEKLRSRREVTYVRVEDVKPNLWNPNRQADHEFELLCRSIDQDGFTAPVIMWKEGMMIVDGEHRWRAARALKIPVIPVYLESMTEAEARVATLTYNRAVGREDAGLAADVLRGIRDKGGLEGAQADLMLDDVEVQRLLQDMPTTELPDLSGDALREQEAQLAAAKAGEERDMAARDAEAFRLVCVFSGDEADCVRLALGTGGQAEGVLRLCREAEERAAR